MASAGGFFLSVSSARAMSETSQADRNGGPTQRSIEIGVTLFTALFAVIVIAGSLQVGIGWGVEGPRAGFFPFYVALLILISSIINFIQIGPKSPALFADWGQLRQVASVLVPSIIYVALIPWIGIYVSSAMLIAVFMKWLGRYHWALVAVISLGVPIVSFVVFERWFLVPLPKGPLEEALGY
jgi:hypothetical protein